MKLNSDENPDSEEANLDVDPYAYVTPNPAQGDTPDDEDDDWRPKRRFNQEFSATATAFAFVGFIVGVILLLVLILFGARN